MTETNAAGSAVKGNSVDVTIGNRSWTSTDQLSTPDFRRQPAEAKEQTAPARIPQSSLQNPQKKRLPHRRSMNRNPQSRKADAAEESKDPKDLLRDRRTVLPWNIIDVENFVNPTPIK